MSDMHALETTLDRRQADRPFPGPDRRRRSVDRRGAIIYGTTCCSFGSQLRVTESLLSPGHLWLHIESGAVALWYLDQGHGAAHLDVEQAKELGRALLAGIADLEAR